MKTLKISEELHKEIKLFCNNRGLKLNYWIEKLIEEKLIEEKNKK